MPKDPANLVNHNKFGVLKSRLSGYDSLQHQPDVGLDSSARKAGHRAMEVSLQMRKVGLSYRGVCKFVGGVA